MSISDAEHDPQPPEFTPDLAAKIFLGRLIGLSAADATLVAKNWPQIKAQLASAWRALSDSLRETFTQLGQLHAELPKLCKARGWFVTLESVPADFPLAVQSWQAGRYDEADQPFAIAIRSRLSEVSAKLQTYWPARAGILEDAFEAHSAGRFNLSIPAMLSQADGMAQDIYGELLFATKTEPGRPHERKPKLQRVVKRLIEQGEEHRVLPFLLTGESPFDDLNSMTFTKTEREAVAGDPRYSTFNRHLVIHGVDTAYGGELNGLRCIALLDVLATAFEYHDDIDERLSVTESPRPDDAEPQDAASEPA